MGVSVAVTRVACNTATGTQDITTSDLGGLTPKAALLIATRGVTDGTAADGAGMYVGVTDGTTSRSYQSEAQHAQAASNSMYVAAAKAIAIGDGTAAFSTFDGEADFSAWITNGIRINWTNAPSAGWLLTVVLFAGTDLSVNVGSADLATEDVGVDVTTVGFEADLVFSLLYNTAGSSNAQFTIAAIHNDRAGTVTQRAVYMRDRDNRPTMEVEAQIRNDMATIVATNAALGIYHEYGSFDSSGFTITPRHSATGNPGTNEAAWLALRFGSSPAISSKVYTFTTPTGTGNNTDTNPAFQPQAVIYFMTLLEAVNTLDATSLAGSQGIAVVTSGAQYSNTWSVEDGAADSNTQSLSDNQAVNLPLHSGSAGMAATYSAFTSTGLTLNWSDIESAGKLWVGVAFGASGATPISGSLSKTLDGVTADIDGRLKIDGDLAKTLDSITAQAQGALKIIGVLNKVLDDISIDATGSTLVEIVGTLDKTLDGVTALIAGALEINATLSKTLDGITIDADGLLAIKASLDKVLDGVSAVSSGILKITGSSSKTLDGITALIQGTLALKASLIKTLDDTTLVSVGVSTVSTSGSLIKTLDNTTISAAGQLLIKGRADKTLDGTTISAAGGLVIKGALAQTLQGVTIAAAGKLFVQGALTKTLDDTTLISTGAFGAVATGSLIKTLGDTVTQASGRLIIQGSLARALEDITSEATGVSTLRASASITLESVIPSIRGALAIVAVALITLEDIGIYARGARPAQSPGDREVYYMDQRQTLETSERATLYINPRKDLEL